MPPLIWESRPDGLRAPALVCAFSGWNDAGEAASSALSFIGSQLGATRFAQLDPEEFFDFQATRPTIRLVEGRTRAVEWPEVEVWAARAPRAPRDLVLVSGPEPSMRWRTFCDGIIELSEVLGVQLAVTLGSLLADVAHTRPVPLVGLASDAALVERQHRVAVALLVAGGDQRVQRQRVLVRGGDLLLDEAADDAGFEIAEADVHGGSMQRRRPPRHSWLERAMHSARRWRSRPAASKLAGASQRS